MKRDMDLVRELLLKIEAAPGKPRWEHLIDAQDPEAVVLGTEHLKLMQEAGLIAGVSTQSLSGPYQLLDIALTWRGHEFLDTIRDSEVWRRTKSGAEKAGVAGIGFVWELAKAYGKQVVTERLGISLE